LYLKLLLILLELELCENEKVRKVSIWKTLGEGIDLGPLSLHLLLLGILIR